MADFGVLSTRGEFDPTTSEESLLLGRLKRVEQNPSGFFAVHLHMSQLRRPNRQSHFINIAARSFDSLLDNFEATLFPLSNADMVLVCRNVPVDDVDGVVEKVRSLFGEDPLTATDDEGFEDKFSTWYDLSLPEDFASFFHIATDLALEAETRLKEEAKTRKEREKELGAPLAPMNLAAINQKLQETNVADMIHQQTCLQVGAGGDGKVVFHENFISMAELRGRIAPDVNLFASPWLFQYLTETLDRRILAAMAQHDFDALTEPVSLNLNVNTVLSRDFQAFHKAVDGNTANVVIEMQVIDIFSDINTYGYARDSLQERGYRVLVDGLSPISLQFFEPALLRSDFVKIAWGPEFQADDDDGRVAELREVVATTGKDSVILARVDAEKAIKWGLEIGVSRFQGFFIDKLVEILRSGKRH